MAGEGIHVPGFTAESMQRLNRVRVHQQVVFLLDILGASKNLARKYLKQRSEGSK